MVMNQSNSYHFQNTPAMLKGGIKVVGNNMAYLHS